MDIDLSEMTPQEMDFYVEEHLIHIIPNFTSGEINLISVYFVFVIKTGEVWPISSWKISRGISLSLKKRCHYGLR